MSCFIKNDKWIKKRIRKTGSKNIVWGRRKNKVRICSKLPDISKEGEFKKVLCGLKRIMWTEVGDNTTHHLRHNLNWVISPRKEKGTQNPIHNLGERICYTLLPIR